MREGRLPAAIALVVLGAGLAVVLAATTPWQPLPATGGAVAPDPARDFTAQELAREDAFHRALRPGSYTSLVVGLAVTLTLGFTSAGARIIGLVAKPFRRWVWQVVAGGTVLAAVGQIVTLPFAAWAEVVLRRYGLSTQDWGAWTVDLLKSFALNTAVLLGAFCVLYALIRAFPRGWWAPAAAGSFVLVVGLSFAYPLVVEPVFNDFRPMADSRLRSDLLAMARKDHVPVREVLVADASRRTTALNAYVSGFGATRRIVVYDTLLEDGSPSEVRLIVAHELGHADERDVLHGSLLGGFTAAAGMCLLYLLVTWRWPIRRAGVSSVADPRSLALLLALVTLFGTVSGPAQNLVSRKVEARADVHSLDLTGEPGGYVRMQHELAAHNLADLDPPLIHHVLFASHPTAPERIATARSWARVHGVAEPPPLAREAGR